MKLKRKPFNWFVSLRLPGIICLILIALAGLAITDGWGPLAGFHLGRFPHEIIGALSYMFFMGYLLGASMNHRPQEN
jgi:hypothetical protein